VPVREAARAMCRAIAEFVAAGSSISSIHVVLWDEEHFAIFERALRRAMRHRARTTSDGAAARGEAAHVHVQHPTVRRSSDLIR